MTTSKPPVIGGRREAREQALLLLYEVEARGGDADLVLDGRTQDFDSFTLDAVYGVNDNLERIDAERASAAGLVTSESKSAVGAGLGALLRASWRVAGPLFMSVGADGASLLVPTTSGTEPRFTIGAAVGAGVAF